MCALALMLPKSFDLTHASSSEQGVRGASKRQKGGEREVKGR